MAGLSGHHLQRDWGLACSLSRLGMSGLGRARRDGRRLGCLPPAPGRKTRLLAPGHSLALHG